MIKKRFILCSLLTVFLMLFSVAYGETKYTDELNNRGNVVSRTWIGEDGNPTAGPEGYARVTYTYKNRNDLPYVTRYFNADGTPYVLPEGYHKVIREYGKDNLVAEESFYDVHEKPCLNAKGFASAKYGYTSFGAIRTAFYYDVNGRKTIVPSLGYASLNCEYKGKSMAACYYYDPNKKPIDSAAGYASCINTLNRSYQILETAYYHADQSPAMGPEGWSKAVYTNNNNGVHLSANYYDTDGKPFVNAEGVSEVAFTYDAGGALTGYKLLRNGNEVPGSNGWSSCTFEYDHAGRTVATRYYDINGRLTDRGSGFAYSRKNYRDDCSYDLVWYDCNESPIARNGYYAVRVETDQNGKVKRNLYLDQEGNPISNPQGVEAVSYLYDDKDHMIGVRYEKADGTPANNNEGYAGYTDRFDETGVFTERVYLQSNETAE